MSGAAMTAPEITADPQFDNLLKVLAGDRPARPTMFELFLNPSLYRVALGADTAARIESGRWASQALQVHGFKALGYDYASIHIPNFQFRHVDQDQKATISLNEGNEISDRVSFDAFDWPDTSDLTLECFDYMAGQIPGSMKLICMGPGGVLENAIGLVGFENLCFMMMDDEQLVFDIFESIGSRLVEYYKLAVSHPVVGGIIGNDDWGFKTQPMLSPDDMRRFVVPWHKRIVEVAHEAGKPAILHSCGNLRTLLDDIIDEIGYDGKHSYEDTIQPVEEAYDEWGSRIAIIGGIDVDYVIRHSEDEVYERSRAMLERAESRGGYALGTGNSVPEYIPNTQYFAMTRAVLETR